MSAAGMTVTILATQLAEAAAKDDKPESGGHDISAGMFGPHVSQLLRELAEAVTMTGRCKDVSLVSDEAGELVAVTLVDEDHALVGTLWERKPVAATDWQMVPRDATNAILAPFIGIGNLDHAEAWAAWQKALAAAPTAPPKPDSDAAAAFWARVYPDGMTAEQVKAELTDYKFMLEEVPKVYCAVTGGLLSYPTYQARTVIAAFEDYMTKHVEEQTKEGDLFTLDQLGMACANAGVGDSVCESISIALDDAKERRS